MSDTFAGIRPIELLMFIPAELCGAYVAFILVRWLYRGQIKVLQPLKGRIRRSRGPVFCATKTAPIGTQDFENFIKV